MFNLGIMVLAFVLFCLVGLLVEPARADGRFAGDAPLDPANAALLLTLFCVSFILYLWATYAVTAKRWHDRDKSGWWSLIGLIPFGSIWMLVECGFLKGTDGPNRFGGHPQGIRPDELVTVFD